MAKSSDEIKELAFKEARKETNKDSSKNYYTAAFPSLVDLVENEDGRLEFLVVDPDNGMADCVSVIEIGDKICKPPPRESLPPELLFPRKEPTLKYIDNINDSLIIKQESDDSGDRDDFKTCTSFLAPTVTQFGIDLYNLILDYYYSASELPSDKYYDLLTIWTFHTYLFEKADYSPIIYFLGLPEKGKSRTLKSMTYAAFRGLRKISITDAQIIRDCTNLRATILMDMMDLWDKVSKSGSEDVFLNRPEKGAVISRVNRPDKGAFMDTDYYSVFGPTAFATNETIHEILDTRALPIVMKNSKKKFTRKIRPEGALDIKERLTAWRAKFLYSTLPDYENLVPGRLGDITGPLLQLIDVVNPERKDTLVELIQEIYESKKKEKSDNVSGQVLLAVSQCKSLVTHGYIKCQSITNEFNKDKSDREKFSSRKVLGRLKTMGFETTIAGGGAMAIVWNSELIDSLCQEYGIEFDPILTNVTTSPSSQTSLSRDTIGIVSEIDNLQGQDIEEKLTF